MDIAKLIDIAGHLDTPGLVQRGVKIANDVVEYAKLVKANAERAGVVLANGDRETLDAIHAEALAANAALDAALAQAEQR